MSDNTKERERTYSERNLVDLHMSSDSSTDGMSVSGDHVDDTRRETSFLDEGAHAESSEGREFWNGNASMNHCRDAAITHLKA
jgi:hypothetical protein